MASCVLVPEALILGKDAPTPHAVLELGPNRMALFGPNGSGKSFMLDALTASLRGWGSTRAINAKPTLILRMEWLDFGSENPSVEHGRRESALLEAVALIHKDFLSIESMEGVQSKLAQALLRAWEPPNVVHDYWADEDLAGLARAGAGQWLFAVTPVSTSAPEWRVGMAVKRGIDADVDAALDRVLEADDAWVAWTRGSDDWALEVEYAPFFPIGGETGDLRSQPFPYWKWYEEADVIVDGVGFPVVSDFESEDSTAKTVRLLTRYLGLGLPAGLSSSQVAAAAMAAFALSLGGGVNEDSVPALTLLDLPEGLAAGALSASDDKILPSERLSLAVDFLQARANHVFQSVLRDAPALELRLSDPQDWFYRPPLEWLAARAGGLPIAHLSRAEQRWARFAIDMALNLYPEQTFVAIDEPELGLHRAAEKYLSAGLTSHLQGLNLVVATHAPAFLDDPETTVVQFAAPDHPFGATRIQVLTNRNRDSLLDLGLEPSDLLARDRVVLLVEGEHDIAVLEELFGRELERLGVRMIPMRGGKTLPHAVDSQVLFHFTDAWLVPLLDKVDPRGIDAAWSEAQRLKKIDGIDAAVQHLADFVQREMGNSNEDKWIGEFLTGAAKIGQENRVKPLGLSKDDIIEYLPPQLVVPSATSWADLSLRFRESVKGEPTGTKFKKWLAGQRGGTILPSDVREWARSLGEPPPELAQLLGTIRELATSHPT